MVFCRDSWGYGVWDELAIGQGKGAAGASFRGTFDCFARRSGKSARGGYPWGVRDGMIRDE